MVMVCLLRVPCFSVWEDVDTLWLLDMVDMCNRRPTIYEMAVAVRTST